MAVARQVVVALLFVSLGGGTTLNRLEGKLQDLGLPLPSTDTIVFSALLALPAVVLLTVRCARAGGWPSAIMAVTAYGVVVLLPLSYRLPALLAACGLAWSLRRWVYWAKPRPVSWAAVLVSTALAFAPVDISVRMRPLA